MRIISFVAVCALVIVSSCNSTRKSLFGAGSREREERGTSIKTTTLMPATPIREVEEKLVTVGETNPSSHKYFVIIGSFRDPANAKKHQSVVRKDGFSSEILKNEAGLYRVSVMATDDVTEARNEIRRIWTRFPDYTDTWLLIKKE
jgi:hypothetical protein